MYKVFILKLLLDSVPFKKNRKMESLVVFGCRGTVSYSFYKLELSNIFAIEFSNSLRKITCHFKAL